MLNIPGIVAHSEVYCCISKQTNVARSPVSALVREAAKKRVFGYFKTKVFKVTKFEGVGRGEALVAGPLKKIPFMRLPLTD